MPTNPPRRATLAATAALVALSCAACSSGSGQQATPQETAPTGTPTSTGGTPSETPTHTASRTLSENLAAAEYAVTSYAQGLKCAWKKAGSPAAAARARDAYLAASPSTGSVDLVASSATNAAATETVVYVCGVAGAGRTAGISREAIVLTRDMTSSLASDIPKSCDSPSRGLDGVDDVHLDLSAPLDNLMLVAVRAYDPAVGLSKNLRHMRAAVEGISRRDLGTVVTYRVTSRGPTAEPYVYACATNGVSSIAKGTLVQPAGQTSSRTGSSQGDCRKAGQEFEQMYGAGIDG